MRASYGIMGRENGIGGNRATITAMHKIGRGLRVEFCIASDFAETASFGSYVSYSWL